MEELKERWDEHEWENTVAEWQSQGGAQTVPALQGIVSRFLEGEIDATALRDELDVFSRTTKHAGFQGTGGQMFLNLLVKGEPLRVSCRLFGLSFGLST